MMIFSTRRRIRDLEQKVQELESLLYIDQPIIIPGVIHIGTFLSVKETLKALLSYMHLNIHEKVEKRCVIVESYRKPDSKEDRKE